MLATQTMAPAGFGVQQGMLMQWAGRMSHSEPLYTGPSPPLTTHEIAARCRNCVFFAKVPPSVLEPELERLFSRCGTVVGINLYRPWALAKTSKGCGIVEYTSEEAAAAAVRQLNGLRHWARAPYPLVVEALDSRRPVVLPSVLQSRQHVLGGYSGTLAAAGAPQQAYYGMVPQQQQVQQAPLYPQQQQPHQQQVLMQAPQQQQQQAGLVYTYVPAGGAEGAGASYGMQTYAGAPMMAGQMNSTHMVALQQPAAPQGVPQQQQQMAAGGGSTYFYMPATAAVGAAPASTPLWAAAGGAGGQGGVTMQMQSLAQSLNSMQLQGMQQPTYVAPAGAGMSPVFSAAAQAPLVPTMQLSPHAANGGGMSVQGSPPPASQQQWVVPAGAMLAASSAPAVTGGFTAGMAALGIDGGMMQANLQANLQANWVSSSEALASATSGSEGASPPMSGGLLAPMAAQGGGGSPYHLHAGGLSDAAAAAHMVHMTQLYAASNSLPSAAMVAPINV